jgi:hypothetical protein
MGSLSDFCKGRDQRPSVRNPWLFPDLGLVAASNGFLIIARNARRGEHVRPAPPEVGKVFRKVLRWKLRPGAKQVRIAALRRWAGRGLWAKDNSYINRPGRVNGQLLNCNWLALLLGRITDAKGRFQIRKTPNGACFSLVTKNWQVHLMGLMETTLGEGQVVPAFRM